MKSKDTKSKLPKKSIEEIIKESVTKSNPQFVCPIVLPKKEAVIVCIEVYGKNIKLTAVSESTNKVMSQQTIDNHPNKIAKALKNLKKKYTILQCHYVEQTNMQSALPEDIEKLQVVNPDAAGIDIGSEENWVCVPPNRCKDNIRQFGGFTCDLYAIAHWLKECNVTTVAMESTGVYWIPLYQILEAQGFEVCLVNAKHFKNVPGRPKTDRLDCKWLQRLHAYGLLSPSFRPDEQICQIRSLLRHRENLVRMNAKNIQYMQKSLDQMNIKLAKVISDITGVTGIKIIEAILNGERDLEKLAELRHSTIKAPKQEIVKSLEGDYRPEHLFTLKQSLEAYNFIKEQILQCDGEIEKYLQEMDKTDNTPTQITFEFIEQPKTNSKYKKPNKNSPNYDANSYLLKIAGVDLAKVPGLDGSTAQTILFEIGLDMHKWKSEKHFASWLGLCPNSKKSAGKILSSKTNKVKNRATSAFRMAARSLQKSQCYLGAFFRRILSRRGFAKAVTATARKLAIIVYHMLKHGVEYQEVGENFYLEKYKEKVLRSLQRRAQQIGFDLVPKTN